MSLPIDIVNNPLVKSVYVDDFQYLAAPTPIGSQEMITENDEIMMTEDDEIMITE